MTTTTLISELPFESTAQVNSAFSGSHVGYSIVSGGRSGNCLQTSSTTPLVLSNPSPLPGAGEVYLYTRFYAKMQTNSGGTDGYLGFYPIGFYTYGIVISKSLATGKWAIDSGAVGLSPGAAPNLDVNIWVRVEQRMALGAGGITSIRLYWTNPEGTTPDSERTLTDGPWTLSDVSIYDDCFSAGGIQGDLFIDNMKVISSDSASAWIGPIGGGAPATYKRGPGIVRY